MKDAAKCHVEAMIQINVFGGPPEQRHVMSMPAALQRRRDYAGPAIFAYGFRPFFLAAGLWAAFGVLLWLPQYMGLMTLPTHFSALDWHVHEMLYGYVAAAGVTKGFVPATAHG